MPDDNHSERRIALTGFMGVGKTSVARHLASLMKCERLDLDSVIELVEKRRIANIIDEDGIDQYRKIETACLRRSLEKKSVRILSLGGGAWITPENRELIRGEGVISIWLDASFNHCWGNISRSRKERPLARDKTATQKLFEERQEIYCLADWHFVVKPDLTSYEVARQIVDEVFS